MFAMSGLRLPIVAIVGLAVATLLALAAFTSAEAAEQQKDAAAKEPTDAATTEGSAQEGPITIENHSWSNYHWARKTNPFTLKVGDNVTPVWDSYLKTTSADWSKSTVLDTTLVTGQAKGKNCRPTAGRDEVCNNSYGQNGWLGLAQIWLSGSHITQGVTKVNDTYFDTTKYNTPAWRNLVMCQEVGHTLGLDHQDENFDNPNLGTCMDYTSDPSTNQHPNQHDYDQLLTIYKHLDSTTTVGASTGSKVPPGNLNAKSEWGQSIFRTADGKVELFERDLGPGARGERETMLTWVKWTDEEVERRGAPSGDTRGKDDGGDTQGEEEEQ
jgi:hypothetical protein